VAVRADAEIARDGHMNLRWTAIAFPSGHPADSRTAAQVVSNAFDIFAEHPVDKPDKSGRRPFETANLPDHDSEPVARVYDDALEGRALTLARTVGRSAVPPERLAALDESLARAFGQSATHHVRSSPYGAWRLETDDVVVAVRAVEVASETGGSDIRWEARAQRPP
jgi:hypothetical protein